MRISSADYARKKARIAEKERLASLMGRDIAPLPPVVDPITRHRCKSDLKLFLETYLPEKFTKPWSHNHLLYIESLQRVLLHGGTQAVAMPRGSGKSTLTLGAVLWALSYGHRRYLVTICATQKESRRMVESIRRILQNRKKYAQDFPEISYPIGLLRGSFNLSRGQVFLGEPTGVQLKSELIRLPSIPGSPSSGSVIACYSVRGALRGQSAELDSGETIRPDSILLDDIQKSQDAANPDRVEKLETEIMGSIAGLADSGSTPALIFTGTVIESGDLTDRILDPEIYPWWHGIRGKVLELWPKDMDRWREFRSLYFTDQEEAKRFYLSNRDAMSAGAKLSWPEDFDRENYVDALHFAMVRWSQNERAFMSEYQNEPLKPSGSAVCVPAKVIMSHVNGLEHRICPHDTLKLSAFCDVHDDVLYYTVLAWSTDFSGFVIDYGTFPEQSRSYFSKHDGGLETLQRTFNSSPNVSLKMGIEVLLSDLVNREYDDEDGKTRHGIDRILIDSKYKPEIVESALRTIRGGTVIPSRGIGIKASNRPMSEWKKTPERKIFWHYCDEKIKGRIYRSYLIDTNYWKSLLHNKLGMNPGEPRSISFWGTDKRFHRLIAEHCNAETVQLVSSGLNEVNEWREKPTRLDNHYFDCLTGCLVGALSVGIEMEGVAQKSSRRIKRFNKEGSK